MSEISPLLSRMTFLISCSSFSISLILVNALNSYAI